MRSAVLGTLERLAATDERIVFITGDLGYGVVEPFFRRFPDRAFNAGVAEQNMLAMATGLAESGLVPFVYSIATFASLRPFEFIRNGAVVHDLAVRVLGVGGGMEYSNNGPTHFALEDVGVLRTLPGLRIICPNDTAQACAAVEATLDLPGPIYFRLSKSDVADIAGLGRGWSGVGADVLVEGDGSVAILALGPLAADLDAIGEQLHQSGVEATTVAVSQVAPEPTQLLRQLAERHDLLVTVEAHHVRGGLGSVVCEVVAEAGAATRVVRLGTRTWPNAVVGGPAHLNRWAGVDPQSVVSAVRAALATVVPHRASS